MRGGGRVRRLRDRLAGLARRPGPEVLVYQMGKVASQTVEATARAARPGLAVHRAHFLSPEAVARYRRWCADPDLPRDWRESNARQMDEGEALRARVEAGEPFRVVTLARDPVGYFVSAFFQNLEVLVPGAGPADAACPELEARVLDLLGRAAADALEAPGSRAEILRALRDNAVTWFGAELRRVLGVDALAAPFDRERGWTRLPLARGELLVLRFEDLDTTLSPALGALLGVPPPAPVDRNRSAQKWYAPLYRRVRERLRLPAAFLERQYGSRYARHFYDEAERAALRARWGGA